MSELLKKLLGELYTEDIGKKVADKELAVVNDGSYIPRQKFTDVSGEVKELKGQLKERDTQLEELKGKATGNEELQTQIEALKAENKKTQEEYDTKLKIQAKDYAIDKAIAKAKGKNPKAIKALLDAEKVSIDGENIIGLKEQLESIQKTDAYLFGSETTSAVGGSTNPADGGGNTPPDIDQQIEEALKAGNTALSISLKNQKYFKE